MEEKKFYRVIYKERSALYDITYYYNASRLHYGIPHIDINSTMYSKYEENDCDAYIKYLDYDQLKDAIKHGGILSHDFDVKKSLFSKKEYIYKYNGFESYKVLPDIGPYYAQKYYISIEEPSIADLKKYLPANEYIEWCRDNGIELSEKAIINL